MKLLFILFISCVFAIKCKDFKNIHKKTDYVFKKADADTYIYFNLCGPITTQFEGYDASDVSVLAYLETYKEKVVLGNTSTESLELVNEGKTLRFSYNGDSSLQLSSRVEVTCGPEDTSSNIKAQIEGSTFIFSFTSPDACPSNKTFPITGLILCIILFVLIGLYIIVTVILNIFVFHKKGLEVIPNYLFWIGLPSLLVDGVKFTFCCKKAGSEYQTFAV
ncbi:hypothetical protein EDI_092310 [Entamoeba dispar SAW760]|uniref:MRH domain-containing protein n=1 Tax=Entamoeba dispar (strain ATCC PRA-260 / SAW760) TaxID=370354 RepID=B0ED23_ENTDS|nr:uncharacterized protein EDI_092310 [Entamoeba dispar SAW760]EDR27440.1 hypothetical protein EDI_092310 [Entamoeba dispar SAW760]|eukprot:EDR27440.1 hypothetical protein EDI_092310 [Entamoeba dispar SAW760]